MDGVMALRQQSRLPKSLISVKISFDLKKYQLATLENNLDYSPQIGQRLKLRFDICWSPRMKRSDYEELRNHDAGFKSRVALEAVIGERTVSELAAEYSVHLTITHQWNKALLYGAANILSGVAKER